MKSSRATRRKRVIAALSLNVYSGQRKLAGMLDFFNERFICENRKWDMDLLSGYERLTGDAIRQYAKEGVDGFMLLCHPPAATVRALAQTGLPCVIETSADAPTTQAPRLIRIFCDTQALACAAAHHFLIRHVFKSYGFVHTAEEEAWSRDRGRFFAETLAQRGHATCVCHPGRDNLTQWLERLPAPAAVCAANDATARHVAEICTRSGLKIPDEIALLGFDDDPVFCLRPEPQLSSVAQDFARCGRLAAEALDRLMRGERNVPRTLSYGARDVVIRGSTLRTSPHTDLIQKALSYIDAHGCGNIGADDIARHLGISRRLVDLRFEQILGRSICEILRERKLEEVRCRLRTSDDSIADITAACGFTNKTHLKNLFRRCTGLSMREYRKGVRHAR